MQKNQIYRRIMLCLVLGVNILVSGVAGASGGIQPGSGVLTMPTADVLRSGTLQASLQWFAGQSSLGLAVAPAESVELAVMSQGTAADSLAVLGKMRLLHEGDVVPNAALGAEFSDEQLSVYGVLSKELGMPGLRVHAAWGTGPYQKGMVGLSAVLNPVVVRRSDGFTMPVTTAVVEYDGAGFNGGLKFRLADALSVQLTMADFQSLGFGLQYRTQF